MKVFYTNSPSVRDKFGEFYQESLKTLKKNKVDILSLEVMKYEDLLEKRIMDVLTPEEVHYLFIKTGIDKSNAVIVDTTCESFQLGHEATIALLYNKPVLCLSKRGHTTVRIFDPRLKFATYETKVDVKREIETFLNEVKNKYLSVRLHVNLSPEHKNFLDWYSGKKGKNISQLIRDSIDTMIHEQDDFSEIESRFSLSSKN